MQVGIAPQGAFTLSDIAVGDLINVPWVAAEAMDTSSLPAAVVDAYRQTHYRVLGPNGFTLIVGQHNPALAGAHAERMVNASAFITACNPYSQPLSEADNAVRHRVLAEDLMARHFTFVEGLGEHLHNEWPPEPSYLVFGMDKAEARATGARYQQNAVIWCGPDAVPQLLLLR